MNTYQYNVAGHTFALAFHTPIAIEEWIPSYTPFKTENEQTNLFFLNIHILKKEESYSKKMVTDFMVDGMKYEVYQSEQDAFILQIFAPNRSDERCTLIANKDFTEGCAFINGALQLQHYALNNFLMMMYGFASSTKDTLLFHSSVIEKENKGYLFLGKSGTGKSTHSRLWLENIPETSLLNDDNPVVRIINNQAFVYGSPWSGKTPCYKNKLVEIGAIVRLKQYPANIIEQQKSIKAYAALFPSVSNMIWDSRVREGISNAIAKLASTTNVFILQCLPNAEAAHLCYETISK